MANVVLKHKVYPEKPRTTDDPKDKRSMPLRPRPVKNSENSQIENLFINVFFVPENVTNVQNYILIFMQYNLSFRGRGY